MAHFLGLCTKELVERQRDLIQDVGLPIVMPSMTFMELWGAMQHDKKVVKGQINCVLPTTIGKVKVVPLVRHRIRQWFTASQSSRGKRLDPLPQAVSRPRLSKKK